MKTPGQTSDPAETPEEIRVPSDGRTLSSMHALEQLTARPSGRGQTTIAIYRNASTARSAATRLHNMGLEVDKFAVVANVSPDEQDYLAPPARTAVEGRTHSTAAPGGALPESLKGLVQELERLGITHDSAVNYELAAREGRSLLIVHGSRMEAGRAAALLEKTIHYGLAGHDC